MFKFLTSKKGYTLVELMLVLALLSLGAYALINIVNVAYNSFNKSEERYLKQEAVKEVALKLQGGSANVAAAKTADIFSKAEVVPAGEETDKSFSYLYAIESYDEKGQFEGYFIYVQNKNKPRASAIKLSEIPIYVDIKPYYETKTKIEVVNGSQVKKLEVAQYNAVTITLSALEDDYRRVDANEDGVIDPPSSDDRYYSLDVTYHFPNMATSENYCMVNRKTKSQLAVANSYNESTGKMDGAAQYAIHCEKHPEAKDGEEKIECSINHESGSYCSKDHCGCEITPTHKCVTCSCACAGKSGIVLRVYCDTIIDPDNTEASISVPSMCFIATASYGLETGEVGALCAFRDECLQTNALGRAFVKAYYTLSPPVAEFISESEPLKAVVRTALKPLIVVAEYALNEEIRAEGAASFVVLMLCGAGASATLIKLNKQRKKEKKN